MCQSITFTLRQQEKDDDDMIHLGRQQTHKQTSQQTSPQSGTQQTHKATHT